VADLPAARNLIVESNAAAERIRPDLFVFIADSTAPDWKDSAERVISRADFVADRWIDDAVIRRVREWLRAEGQ
jgi:hypothetical protein